MKFIQLFAGVSLAVLAGCVAPGAGASKSRDEATAMVVERLQAGDRDAAATVYRNFDRARRAEDQLLAPLYDRARASFEGDDPRLAADLLALLSDERPDSVAIAEARVHALFLTRAREGRDAELETQLAEAIDELRELAPGRPGWVDLAAAQLAVDRGDVAAARRSFTTFEAAWTGYPEQLTPYVVDLRRYLEAHAGAGTR